MVMFVFSEKGQFSKMLNRLSSVLCRCDIKCVCFVIFLLTIANLFIVTESYNARDCGVPLRRHTRQPRDRTQSQLRIIKGRESKRGAWPWQVSLQLLHPSFGFIGHWCGGVLVHPYWLLTAAHCIHNELFNLPIAALWTAVLGEWGRSEQRGAYVPIERIVLHQRFHHYQHDIALMKMTKSADLTAGSKIRAICLPPIKRPNNEYQYETTSTFYVRPVGVVNVNKHNKRKQINKPSKPNPDSALKYLEKLNNLTKSVLGNFFAKKNKNMRYNIRLSNNDSEPRDNNNESNNNNNNNKGRKNEASYDGISLDSVVKLIRDQVLAQPVVRMKVDGQDGRNGKKLMYGEEIDPFIEETNGLGDGGECYATGWGRQQTNGTLTDILLEAVVPTLPIQACREKYPMSLPLMEGHLCAGNVDGSTGTCVGDSGGPLQCLGADGRWVLRGITSFGSGCAQPGVPDVYTYVPHYTAWIHSVIDAD